MYNPFSLEGKTILITGASSGIGEAAAIQCSKLGGKIILTARNKERLEKTFSQLVGEEHEFYIADLTIEDEIGQLIKKLPPLDGVVHSAGIGGTKPVKFLKKEFIDKIFFINYQAPVLLSQKLVAGKILKKESSIVFISSIAADDHSLGNSIYGSSKGAVTSFAKYLAKELVTQKIRVNSILPGTINTPLSSSKTISDEQWTLNEKEYPLGGFGVPEDIAYLIIYLLSNASKWMTGNKIRIDGGYSLS